MTQSPATKSKLKPTRFDGPLLPVVVVIIVISLGALVEGWRDAHTSAPRPKPATTQPPVAKGQNPDTTPASQPPSRPKNED